MRPGLLLTVVNGTLGTVALWKERCQHSPLFRDPSIYRVENDLKRTNAYLVMGEVVVEGARGRV
jgi:hypothetical protein